MMEVFFCFVLFLFFFPQTDKSEKRSFLKRRVFTAPANPGPLRWTVHSCAISSRKIPPKYLRISSPPRILVLGPFPTMLEVLFLGTLVYWGVYRK